MREYILSLNDPIAIVGLVASIIVLVSMCFDTKSKLGSLLMRTLNLIGSVVSVAYGYMLGPLGAGIILLNGVLVVVNTYYIVKTLKLNN